MISVNFVFLKGEIAESCQIINLLRVPIYVMPESQNLPMTTREPISDAKATEFLLPSSSWGSHQYRRSGCREEPRALGFIAYIGYSRARNLKNWSFWVGRRLTGYLLKG